MKTKLSIPLMLIGTIVCTGVHANNVNLKNSSNSVNPLTISYVVAQKSVDGLVEYGKTYQLTLKPGETTDVDVPQRDYQYAGVIVTKFEFTTGKGKKLTQSFNKSSFGDYDSCSYATSTKYPSGNITFMLREDKLTCHHDDF